MSAIYVLDTHTLVWILEGNPKLSERAKQCVLHGAAQLVIPAIALAEACAMIQKQRTAITIPELTSALDADARFVVLALDKAIVLESQAFISLSEMHDRLIVASTKHVPGATLITCDEEIRTVAGLTTIW